MKRVIEAKPGNQRVSIVASGGLSHFVVDEDLDREVLAAMVDGGAKRLRELPRSALTHSAEAYCAAAAPCFAPYPRGASAQVHRILPLHLFLGLRLPVAVIPMGRRPA
ncbi:hypothetical protein [Cupriavidus sp. IDO]|uniref:hypothetical protein n=1 Tax=Cupriavidus sp. IDO TaxID=1539142 RepID=UPI001269D8B2